MEFEFIEGDYDGDYAGGGELIITAKGSEEVKGLLRHFKLFEDVDCVNTLKARIKALENETWAHTVKPTTRKLRPIYKVIDSLGSDFTAPYVDWAKDDFGFEGPFPDLEIEREWDGLKHTKYQGKLFTRRGTICHEVYISSEPWGALSAREYAYANAKDYLAEEFGDRYHEPEYARNANGQYSRNPNYLKRRSPAPSDSNSRLKLAFFSWWMENHANAAQLDVIAGNAEIIKEAGAYMNAFTFTGAVAREIHYKRVEGDYLSMTFKEFAALK